MASKFVMLTKSDDFGNFGTERTSVHTVRLKNVQRSPYPKQNIALLFHSSAMTVAPCPHFRTKVKIIYSIEGDDLFL